MPAFAQFLLKRRNALSKVSFSLTTTFDIVSHLTSLQLCIVPNTTVWVFYCTASIIGAMAAFVNIFFVICLSFFLPDKYLFFVSLLKALSRIRKSIIRFRLSKSQPATPSNTDRDAAAAASLSGVCYLPAIWRSCASIIFFTIYPPTEPFCLEVRSPL